MSPENTALLERYGMDTQRTLARFAGNEKMMLTALKDLPNDDAMTSALAAKASDDDKAFRVAVHSVKGLSGNLGLEPLYEAACALMIALRAEDQNEVERLFMPLCEEYHKAVEMTRTLTLE